MDRLLPRLALWAAGLLAAAWVLGRFSTLVTMAVIVLIVTFPIYPVVDWLEERWRLSRSAAATLTLLGLTVVLILGLAVVIPWIMGQAQVLIGIAPRGAAARGGGAAHHTDGEVPVGDPRSRVPLQRLPSRANAGDRTFRGERAARAEPREGV